ncbi:hypothetical protein Dsin_014086 [Dipteronia sinensis]|uniref:Uncharacterized protein n=1 Tax=Dipteronia sinensis TaxID=43782 RepID=A0AAE0E9L4_9ROSI|nr:hypothetical protein Dsin_014086 [Dipteronia sinensis]
MTATTVQIHTPNLIEFTYVGNVIYFSSNALALSETDISICSDNIVNDTQWYVGYIQLLENFHHSKVLNINSWTDEAVIIPAGVRQIQPSPLFGVKQVNFKSGRQYRGSTISKILDDLLWIAPHAETISIKSYCNRNKSSFKYKKHLTADCCKSLPVACWRHCIKEVEIVNARTLKEEEIVKRYLLQEGDVYEKIVALKDLGDFIGDL